MLARLPADLLREVATHLDVASLDRLLMATCRALRASCVVDEIWGDAFMRLWGAEFMARMHARRCAPAFRGARAELVAIERFQRALCRVSGGHPWAVGDFYAYWEWCDRHGACPPCTRWYE